MDGEIKFVHNVSKGSRYNQIYIPKEYEDRFEIGDKVEIRLLGKKSDLFYSRKIELSKFKKRLVKEIFSFLSKYKEIKQVFIFGSFLTKNIDYNDIDLMLIIDKEKEEFDKKIYDELIEEFNLKFHVISVDKDRLNNLLMVDTLIRNAIYSSISNKKIYLLPKRIIDENRIRFELMYSEDVLNVNVNSKMLYDALKRAVLIEYFLKGVDLDRNEVEKIIVSLIRNNLYGKIIKDDFINKKEDEKIKKIIKLVLWRINLILKDGKKG